jgi:tRNA-splicing ligase RtcB
VVSPGGVGFDISCGVRLLVGERVRPELQADLGHLMDLLAASIPRGVGRGGVLRLTDPSELEKILLEGSAYVVHHGYGHPADLTFCEDEGTVAGADPGEVSARAAARGRGQVGSLGRAITSSRFKRSTRSTTVRSLTRWDYGPTWSAS